MHEAFSGVQQKNRGIIYAAQKGTPVYATAAGVVKKIHRNGPNGLCIDIIHKNSVTTKYSHIESVIVREGIRVKKGQQIGTVGESGWTVGPQLLYEILKNGKPVDPTLLVQEEQ